MGLFGLFSNKKKETIDKGLVKTKESVFGKLARAVAGKSTVDDDVLDDLETCGFGLAQGHRSHNVSCCLSL